MLLRTKDILKNTDDPVILGIVAERGAFLIPSNVSIQSTAEDKSPCVIGRYDTEEPTLPETEYIVTLRFRTARATLVPYSSGTDDKVLLIDWPTVGPVSPEA